VSPDYPRDGRTRDEQAITFPAVRD